MLLAQAERAARHRRPARRVIPDRRDPTRVTHALADMLRARIFAIACGYEDCNDLDRAARRSGLQARLRAAARERARIWLAADRCRGWRMRRACATPSGLT